MTPEELDEAMGVLRLNAQRLALRVGVTDRTVRRWLDGTRNIPPPVEKLVNLWLANPSLAAIFGIRPDGLPD